MVSEENISSIFSGLIDDIRKMEISKRLSIKEDELINNAIRWLKDHQHPEGYWGYESVADTGLVLLALSIYGIKEKEWIIKGTYKGGIQKSVNWLKSVLNIDNWGGNLWDTSICAQALLKLGIGEEWVFRIIEWIRKECKEKSYKYPIHHLAQAIKALLEAGLEEEAKNIGKILAAKVEEVVKKEAELFDPYACGQVLDALINSKFDLTNKIVQDIEKSLKNFLEEKSVKGISEGSFQDVMMAFMGLTSFLGGEDTPLVNSIMAELFKTPERYKEDGSWYHDAKKTAFALIGLSGVKDIRKINEFPNKIYKVIMDHEEKTKELFRKLELENEKKLSIIKRGYFWLSVAYCSILISFIIAVYIGTEMFIPQLIIEILLGTIFISAAIKAYFSYKGRVKG